jgi:hypothetical protein
MATNSSQYPREFSGAGNSITLCEKSMGRGLSIDRNVFGNDGVFSNCWKVFVLTAGTKTKGLLLI